VEWHKLDSSGSEYRQLVGSCNHNKINFRSHEMEGIYSLADFWGRLRSMGSVNIAAT